MELTKREKEIIYCALSELLNDEELTNIEFDEIDDLRDLFYTDNSMPTF